MLLYSMYLYIYIYILTVLLQCFSLETLAALTCQVKTVKRTKCTRVRTVHGALRVERHRPPGLPVSSRKRQKHRDVQQALKPGFLERSLSELLVHKSLLLQLLKQETWHSSMISSSLLHMKDLHPICSRTQQPHRTAWLRALLYWASPLTTKTSAPDRRREGSMTDTVTAEFGLIHCLC